MTRILMFCIQAALIAIACCVMSKYLRKETKPLMDHPWYHSTSNKLLRQGLNNENNHGQTEAPQNRDCVCSKIYDPVCATNNESYFNLCFLECKVPKEDNVTVVHQGNCIPF